MALRAVLGVCAIVVAASTVVGASPARRPAPPEKLILAAIARQAALGHLDAATAAYDRRLTGRTALLARRLPAARAGALRSQLAQAAAIAPRLTAPRALAIFGQLEANDDWFARHGPPAPQTDIRDADGVLYRYFAGTGFEFHPLGNFGALNALAAAGNIAGTARLADALLARGVPAAGGGTSWEYYFDYSGGAAPWTSGFAQAVAAQAFAHAASIDTADSAAFLAAARSAYRAIPGRLVRETLFGPWIELYSFNRALVLNAQLQSVISLAAYAKATSDAGAASLATGLENAAARALPSFTSGYWSYYQLPDDPSPVSYQDYVVQLLQTLSRRDDRFAAPAARFASFATTPPRFRLATAGVGAVAFWVSKPSAVRVSSVGRSRQLSVAGGWHTVSWTLPQRAGVFPVSIHATDWEGNSASVEALPIVHVAAAPSARPAGGRKLTAATRVAAALPPLVVGAGLDQPEQASLATSEGFGAVRMTLVWPPGASTPDPGAVAALQRLPSGTNLVLELDAAPLPADSSSLAAYAAAVAAQVPALHDLVLVPAPSPATGGAYEATLAAVYDAVKSAAPGVEVDGDLDGADSPKRTLATVASAYASSGRTTPFMDELAFMPAPAAGVNLWPLSSLPTLTKTLGRDFAGAAQPGSSLPLIIDGLASSAAVPAPELSLYSSPSVGTAALDEAGQASAYAAALRAVACSPNVVAALIARLVDSPDPGGQSGLFYPDSTPKSSLAPVAAAVATAQSPTRGCAPVAPPPTATTAGPTPTPPPRQQPSSGERAAATHPTAVAATDQLLFPPRLRAGSPPSVHLGCTASCLYLVTMERARDGIPVLARRGTIAHAGARTVTLPRAPTGAGRYRFEVWIVAASNPGPVSVARSPTISLS